tara:strand:+ start:284 stop:2989 length:2706 start_codon:yes stop_codon:yes gene_type:complete
MSNTTNVGNFSVKSFTSPSSVPEGDYIDDYLINYLTLVPDNGFAINANDFSAATQLPNYVSSVVFFQSTQDSKNVICQVQLIPGTVMPSGGIDIELCISGFSNTANYNIKGLFDYARSSNVVPAALGTNYDSSGSFEATENVFTQSVSADAGYYFPDQPTISLSIGDNARYTSSFSNDTDINGNIINTVFTINYIFPDYNITGDLWEIIADAQVIYVPVVEITNYTINTSLFSEQGGQRYYSIFGSENANWVLTASNSNNINDILLINSTTGELSNTLSGTLDSTGFAEVLIIIPPSASPQSFDLLISGDLANPFAQPTTATLQQVADVTQTYATLSNNGLVVTPGNYTKTGFSYASYTSPSRPLTSVAWTVAPSSASNLVTLLNTSDIEDNIANNDLFEIEFTTSGTSTVHVLAPFTAGTVLPGIAGWKFIQNTNYSPSVFVVLYDEPTNSITFNTPITVVAGQIETIGNNNGNLIEAPLIVSEVLPNVTISGNILVDRFGFADNTFTFLLDQFLVESNIPTLVTSNISNIQSGSTDSGGEQINDNYAEITIKGIQWSEFSDFSVILGTTDNGNGTADYTSTMTGLVEGDTYYVRAYATNYSGTGYGQTISFLHPITVTIPTLTTSSIDSITGTTATSGGESLLDNGGAITFKGVEWSTDSNFSPIDGTTSDGTGTANYTSSITGLYGGITYYVRAYAINSAGTGYGQILSFTNIVITPCNATATPGSSGIDDIGVNLDSTGGLIAFLVYGASNIPDKFEIYHGADTGDGVTVAANKVATSGINTIPNSGPFDDVWGTGNTSPNPRVPTEAQTSGVPQFIDSSLNPPTRQAEFTTETNYIVTNMYQNGTAYQQVVWWLYDASDYQVNTTAVLRVTAPSGGGTVWRVLRLCCPDGNCIESN